MIITCPNCSARYRVKDELIKEKGKRVKCKKCTALFVAYPNRPEVLEQAPDAPAAAAPTPPKVAPQPKLPQPPAAAPTSGATVRVDRSQLDKFITNQGEGNGSTLKIDPAEFQKHLAEQQAMAAGATVQVDRSQINAFLKGAQQPDTSDTVQMDPDQISKLADMQQAPEQTATQKAEPLAPTMPTATAPTMAAPAPPKPEPPKVSDEPDLNFSPPEPAFPSDEELGIGDADKNAPTMDMPAIDVPAPPELATESPLPPPPVQSAPSSTTLYQVEVDGNVYPNLELEAIARWIREGRLLETDRVAPNGTTNYQQADAYPDIVRYFQEYGPYFNDGEPEPDPPKKKGFFARLFSFGK